jgi:hypothetical protein
VGKKLRAFRLEPELDDKLSALAESQSKDVTAILVELITAATRGEDPNRYAWLETSSCSALVHIEDGFYCAIKAPQHKKLGDGSNEDAHKICEAHKKLLAEKPIKAATPSTNDPKGIFYSCGLGALTDPERPEYVKSCPMSQNLQHHKYEWCLTADDGEPCPHLEERTIALPSKKARPQPRR